MMIGLKEKIMEVCKKTLSEKINEIEKTLSDLFESMSSETKSPLGDKHETARARMQSEQDQLSGQLAEFNKQLRDLEKINDNGSRESIFTGSLIETNKGYFLIAVPIGKIKVGQMEVYVISPASPVGKLFIGLQNHAEFSINDTKYKILNIY